MGNTEFAWVLVGLAVLAVGCEEGACERVATRAASCGMPLSDGICHDNAWDCRLGCLDGRDCETLNAYFDGEGLPPEDRRCMSACARFSCGDGTDIGAGGVCDGTQDCSNGADERGCSYMTCADGMVLHARGSCEARDERFARLAATDDDAGSAPTDAGDQDEGADDAGM